MSKRCENLVPRGTWYAALAVAQILIATSLLGCDDSSSEDNPVEGDGKDSSVDENDQGSAGKAGGSSGGAGKSSSGASAGKGGSGASAGKSGSGDSGGKAGSGGTAAEADDAGVETPNDKTDASTETPEKDASVEPGEDTKDHVYAYVRSIEEAFYVTLTNSIDFKSDSPELALSKAREFKGSIEVVAGNLLEFDGSMVKQWKIDDKLAYQSGPTVSFSQYPLPEGANYFFQFMVDDHNLYLPFDVSSRIVWDPTDMKIVEVMDDSNLPLMVDGGLMALPGGNRSGIHYKNQVKSPFFYLDEEYLNFAPNSVLATYDRMSHKETGLIDLPCPGLAIATQDEQGNTYYSTWDFSPLLALYDRGPKPCVARLTPDDKLDAAWTTDMTDLTGGRYSANFRYVRDGWGVMDVLDHEGLDFDFEASTIPEAAVAEVWEKSHWRVWFVDLKNKQAHPLEDLGDDIHRPFWELRTIDDRNFIHIETEDEKFKVYELSKTGSATLYDAIEQGDGIWHRVR